MSSNFSLGQSHPQAKSVELVRDRDWAILGMDQLKKTSLELVHSQSRWGKPQNPPDTSNPNKWCAKYKLPGHWQPVRLSFQMSLALFLPKPCHHPLTHRNPLIFGSVFFWPLGNRSNWAIPMRCSWAGRPELPALLTKLPQLAVPRSGLREDEWIEDGDEGRCGGPFVRPRNEISQAESGNSGLFFRNCFFGGWMGGIQQKNEEV